MELLHHLGIGFAVAFTPQNLLCALFGCLLGTVIGVLPRISPVATIAMLLPCTYALDATPALIMLAGVYYGAQYGGSTAAILINVPGESSSLVTAIDGYQMARQGRAGAALATAALGSFFAGCVGTIIIAALALPLTRLAFNFGPAEYFSLMVLGLIGAVVLAPGSPIKAIAMIVIGLLLAQFNRDLIPAGAGEPIEIPKLGDGIGLVVIATGVFALAQIIANLGQPSAHREVFASKVGRLWPNRRDFAEGWPSVLRGSALGSILGILPGSGALLASFASYRVEKNLARNPRIPFGKGAIQGVAGPESANNAGAQTSFVPMLTLGIPPNAVMALLVGAMTIKGIHPGPQVMTANPQLFWGLIASMWIGNAMLVVLNLPLVGVWIKLLTVPYRFLFPAIALFCCIGAYALGRATFDVYLIAIFAFIGYVFYKLSCEPAPLLLGFVLGPMMEENLRLALQLSHGDWRIFMTRPLSSGLLIAAALLIVVVTLPSIRRKREVAFPEDD
jgi:putative tricarboxylic transport membrane protein